MHPKGNELMAILPGKLFEQPLYCPKLPESEYDAKGIPIGILPDYDNPYRDSLGNVRRMIIYRPSTIAPMLLTYSLYVVCDIKNAEEAERYLVDSGLGVLAEREKMFVIFPLAIKSGWNSRCADSLPDDAAFINSVLEAGKQWYLFEGRENGHDYRIGFMGSGTGADMIQAVAARYPMHANSMLVFGGSISTEELQKIGRGAELFVWLVDPDSDSVSYWLEANGLASAQSETAGRTSTYRDPDNFAKQVRITNKNCGGTVDEGILMRFWAEAFSSNLRILSCGMGDVFNSEELLERRHASIHIHDRSLGDNSAYPHNWYEFVPNKVISAWENHGIKSPLIIEMHGGGSVPCMSVAKVQYQEYGEEQGFITVYANASANNSWNSIRRDDRINDVEYITALVERLVETYPVDKSRIYISGFSNGSGMAHLMAAARPDLFAGLIAFNTRYPVGEPLYELARKAKNQYDYRMPVFSTYGTKDHEFPMTEGCGQFTQMKLWKWYNHLDNREPDVNDPSRIGAPGDKILVWGPQEALDQKIFTTHCFATHETEPLYLYNYTLVEGMPHTVERRLIPAAWAYISQFSRNEDGSLVFTKNNESII